jgi:predicted O-methyltransferase YrrM
MSGEADAPQAPTLEEIQRLISYVEAVYRAVLNRPPTLPEVEKYANQIHDGISPMDVFHAINDSDERRAIAKLFVTPGSYQSPVANPAELHDHVRALAAAGPELTGITIDRDAMIALWERLLPFLVTFPFPAAQTPGFRYYFENMFYGVADALMLQAMLRLYVPKRFIEIGSGFSSACAVDTSDRFLAGATEFTFIEPNPERLLGLLGERAQTSRFFHQPVQAVSLDVFDELEAGDMLFIDSSHVLRTGSDVCRELFDILPRLASGVIVHIHDILWPFDYSEHWIVQQNRSYNEAYGVRAFLTDNPNWKILFFNDYFGKFEGERIRQTFPDFGAHFGDSLWLEKI